MMPNPLLTNPQIKVSPATASQASSSKITTSPLAIFIKISLPNNHLKTYHTMVTNLYIGFHGCGILYLQPPQIQKYTYY